MKCLRTHVDTDFLLILVCGARAHSLAALFSSTVYKTDLSPSVGFIACLMVINMAAAVIECTEEQPHEIQLLWSVWKLLYRQKVGSYCMGQFMKEWEVSEGGILVSPLRSRSISVSRTTKGSLPMKLYLKLSVMTSGSRMDQG
jgi:hypothetical protein